MIEEMDFIEHGNLKAYITSDSFIIEKKSSNEISGFELDLFNLYVKDKWEALLELAFLNSNNFASSINILRIIASSFVKKIAFSPEINFKSSSISIDIKEDEFHDLLAEIPFIDGIEYIDEKWIFEIYKHLNNKLNSIVKEKDITISDFLISKNIFIPSRIYFHLVENKIDNTVPFAFMATYTEFIDGKIKHYPLSNVLNSMKNQPEKLADLVVGIKKIANSSSLINNFIQKGDIFFPIKLEEKDALTVLNEIPLYEANGIICRIPKWYTEKTCSIKIDFNEKKIFQQSLFTNNALNCFVPILIYHGVEITIEDVKALLSKEEGLQYIKGGWINNNHKDLEQILSEYNILSKEGFSLLEILKTKNLTKYNEQDIVRIEFCRKDWQNFFSESFKKYVKAEIPNPYNHLLRDYQKDAFYWLYGMMKFGLGVCLADDMGLGKTVEVLSLLAQLKKEGIKKILIIVPPTLIANWQNEINKFSPDMDYSILRGTANLINGQSGAFLTLTTYQTTLRSKYIQTADWDLIVLDEAQAIKNYYTSQTKMIKSLKSKMRIIMTGTPIENNILELWSLFDFINPGLLGSRLEFLNYLKQSQQLSSRQNLERQKMIKAQISPFILRRVKTDKKIIADLPEKNEINIFLDPTKEQVVLYRKVIDDMNKEILTAKNQHVMRAVVLKYLIKLKQICNHPSQYYGDSLYEVEKSSKFIELKNICDNIAKKHEKVLIFTQFKEIIPAIVNMLEGVFQKKGAFIDGSVSLAKRSENIRLFQLGDYPYMVLSLKTGGVGINLTEAQNVIHFDRWWNPAVENQATDRVYRIGQKHNVTIYKFITNNTIEKIINELLESKQKIADEYINSLDTDIFDKLSIEQIVQAMKYGGKLFE